MEWINVNDRLPKPGTYVIGCIGKTLVREVVLMSGGQWIQNGYIIDKAYGGHNGITHWMPFPKLPIKKEDNTECQESSNQETIIL